MANTIIYIQENGFNTKEDLQKSYEEISRKLLSLIPTNILKTISRSFGLSAKM